MRILDQLFVRSAQFVSRLGPAAEAMSRRAFVGGASVATFTLLHADTLKVGCHGLPRCYGAARSATPQVAELRSHGPSAQDADDWSSYSIDGCGAGCDDYYGLCGSSNCWDSEQGSMCCDCQCYNPERICYIENL